MLSARFFGCVVLWYAVKINRGSVPQTKQNMSVQLSNEEVSVGGSLRGPTYYGG